MEIHGTLNAESIVSGEIPPEIGEPIDDFLHGKLAANLEPIANSPQEYTGSYVIDPLKRAQILPTNGKLMVQDLEVLGIYYYEVTNANGGKTVTIGRD